MLGSEGIFWDNMLLPFLVRFIDSGMGHTGKAQMARVHITYSDLVPCLSELQDKIWNQEFLSSCDHKKN